MEEQLSFLNDHKKELFKKIEQFQTRFRKGYLNENVLLRCCNFPLLEQKCVECEKKLAKT